MTALLALAGLALVCGTTVAVRWIERCRCNFPNTTHMEDQ